MAGNCFYCGKETKTKMNFIDEKGKRILYHCCMMGDCANMSINRAFRKKEDEIENDFDIGDSRKLFADAEAAVEFIKWDQRASS